MVRGTGVYDGKTPAGFSRVLITSCEDEQYIGRVWCCDEEVPYQGYAKIKFEPEDQFCHIDKN